MEKQFKHENKMNKYAVYYEGSRVDTIEGLGISYTDNGDRIVISKPNVVSHILSPEYSLFIIGEVPI